VAVLDGIDRLAAGADAASEFALGESPLGAHLPKPDIYCLRHAT
jgi:hypothetical protein